jgi:hypothetical protein
VRRQAQLGAAVEQGLGDQLEGVQVLAQQEHGLGAHALLRQEFVGALADALGQHHQLADRGDLAGEAPICSFSEDTVSALSSRSETGG